MTTAGLVTDPAVVPEARGALSTLPYADLPSRWGVSVEKLADGVRVVVPPVPGWRQLHAGFFVGGAMLALFVAFGAYIAYQERDWTPLVGNGILYGGGLLWVILGAWHRLRRRVTIEINGRTVSVTHLSGRGPGRPVEWPRAKVSLIKLNAGNGKLVIRVTGVAFVELYLGPNRELNGYVANLLAAALREPVAAAPVEAPQPPAMRVERIGGDGVASRRAKGALLALAAVMAAAGVIVMLLPFPGAPAGIYLLIFSMAPVGIALGTQDKEYYL